MGNAVSQFSSPLSSEDDDGLSLTSTMTQTFGRNGRRRDTNWNESVSRWVDTCQEELFNPRHAFGNAYARYVWCHLHTTALPDSQRTQTGYPESPWFQVDFHGKSLATMDPLPKIILTLHKSNSNGGVSTLQKSIFCVWKIAQPAWNIAMWTMRVDQLCPLFPHFLLGGAWLYLSLSWRTCDGGVGRPKIFPESKVYLMVE